MFFLKKHSLILLLVAYSKPRTGDIITFAWACLGFASQGRHPFSPEFEFNMYCTISINTMHFSFGHSNGDIRYA